jgi:uncharacterized protein (TIGR00251 family)
MLRLTEKDGGVLLDIAVKPRASREGVGPVAGDRLVVAVSAPPVDGKANLAVIRVLAGTFGVSRSSVSIVRGETGRKKTVRVAGITAAAVVVFRNSIVSTAASIPANLTRPRGSRS